MNSPRVTPWQDGDSAPPSLLGNMRARRPRGELIGIDRVLLRSVSLAEGWNELLGRVRAEFSLALEYRELIMLRVAVLNGATFEWDVHFPAYLQAGGTREKADALLQPHPPGLSSLEQLLIELTDQSTQRVDVDGHLIDALKLGLGEEQTVEAVATVAAYNMVSRFLVALGIR
ncbi:carboxymuconolactone decarboxylase family protein [Stenotrophomonas sp. ZAC14D2_NAIMI4_7]|uniref:carboxymuconolactone decarboxylase family protein n=1 Tax=Stenotrophomonas sp. ZAC14D2_NAIMI4_7 TaxID=2072405 RepID=UPI000D541A3C|nr:carboxymuconolactone decarboxylase family protein [Stenotrophomonas sp. ZAC14D2_NAIMI4_7]AWH18427.1 carboxymuconolactone decarboxylase family protein [Stenotrophomonas sp. ZAC14D2_NAIMI4_7]